MVVKFPSQTVFPSRASDKMPAAPGGGTWTGCLMIRASATGDSISADKHFFGQLGK